ncbi:hypothetical protein TEA_010922 [Camellia sinensis var. sinensis]|uniref:valine--tRNA ligase n=1 Tax=Camellia sinensis var. sinensis TaxID=542762 RepID=A0A4S4EX06_CAMSN|nr:hypothetical protein TEA_010922 [Camellia sinensis var. sinensis]
MVMLGIKLGGDVPFRKVSEFFRFMYGAMLRRPSDVRCQMTYKSSTLVMFAFCFILTTHSNHAEGSSTVISQVYLHPMIRDAHGRKMSKSLGNVIDPQEVINGITLEALHKRLEQGNLDPTELEVAKEGQKKDFPTGIPECGADALRFALVSYTAQTDKINLDIQRVVGYRQWCNKLWNAVRFAISKLGDDYTPPTNIVPDVMPFSCQWMLSVLNKAISKTVSSLDSYEFSDAASAVYSWWQFQLCDVFIEAVKPYFANDNSTFASARSFARDTLWVCLDNGLRLLHPFMPFVTEELWQRLPSSRGCTRKESIMICNYPSVVERIFTHILHYTDSLKFGRYPCQHDMVTGAGYGRDTALYKWIRLYFILNAKEMKERARRELVAGFDLVFDDFDKRGLFDPLSLTSPSTSKSKPKCDLNLCWTNGRIEYEMDMVESAVKSLRSLMPAKERHERRAAFALCRTDAVAETVKNRELEISTLAALSSLKFLSENDAAPAGCAVSVVNESLSVYLKLRGTLNAEAELEKLQKKMEDIQKHRDNLTKMMDASGYREKVPPHIHEENIAKLSTLMQELLSFEQASQHLEREIATEGSENDN